MCLDTINNHQYDWEILQPQALLALALFCLGFLRVAQLGGVGGQRVPAAYNSKTVNDNEMKLGGVVEDH